MTDSSVAMKNESRSFVPLYGAALVFPAVVLVVLDKYIYFASETHTLAIVAATIIFYPYWLLLMRQIARASMKGLNPALPLGATLPRKSRIVIAGLCFASIYCWSLVASVGTLLPFEEQGRTYLIDALPHGGKSCTWKVEVMGWLHKNSGFCVDHDFWQSLRVGNKVVVHGYFSQSAVFVVHVSKDG